MIVIQALYFALPMYLANMSPVLMKWVPFLNYPIDANKKLFGRPILGKNKTWRGLLFAIIFGLITIFIQRILFDSFTVFRAISIFDYYAYYSLLYGGLVGFGAIVGDALKSFFKRRLNRDPGSAWFPFDQIDFIIGGLLFGSILYRPSWIIIIIILIFTPLLHWLVNVIAFKLKLKDVPW